MSRRQAVYSILLAALILLAAVPGVSAFTAAASPTDYGIARDGTISMTMNGLAAGDSFKYRVYSQSLVTSGNTVTMTTSMPFNLKDGTSSTVLTTTGMATGPTVTVRRMSDSSEIQKSGATITSANNIKAGSYQITITGTKSGSFTDIDYTISGTVDSTSLSNPSTLSISLGNNVNSGFITVEAYNSGALVATRTYKIAEGQSPESGGTDSDTGSDTGGDSGAGAGTGQGAAEGVAQLAPEGASPSSVTMSYTREDPANPNSPQVTTSDYTITTDPAAGFTASVSIPAGQEIVNAQGQPVGEITITPVADENVPAAAATGAGSVFSFGGQAVVCEPAGTTFSQGATISFSVPAGYTGTPTVMYYDSQAGQWSEQTGTITTNPDGTATISVTVNHFSMYALFYKASVEPKPTTQTFSDIIKETPAGSTNAVAATPSTVVTVKGTQLAGPETTPAPGFGAAAVFGAALVFGYIILRKRE